jgi:hypothetical protein
VAKDDREILHGIRFPIEHEGRTKSQLFTTGMEDELAEVATSEQLAAWLEAGDIKGTWKAAKAEEKKASAKK